MKRLDSQFTRVNPKVKRGILLINLCILELVIKKNGKVSFIELEEHTGLKDISLYFLADLLKVLCAHKLLIKDGDFFTGNVAELTKVVAQEKTALPENHNKLWSEKECIQLAELKMQDESNDSIAVKMGRTESSVSITCTMLRKAYRLIPIINNNKTVLEFVKIPVGPNPKD